MLQPVQLHLAKDGIVFNVSVCLSVCVCVYVCIVSETCLVVWTAVNGYE